MRTSSAMRRLRNTAVAAVAVASAACASGAGSPTGPSSAAGSTNALAAAAAACVAQVNDLRASVGDAPLAPSDRITSFSNEAARVDGQAHQAHKYFLETNGGNGTAFAENVIPWWKLSDWGSVDAIVRKGITQMWAEGPSGYHYANMHGRYTEMGCGISINNGEVTVSQDFR